MSKKFRVIVADCPWPFKDSLKMSDVKRGSESNYSVMTISDIEQLPIKALAHKDGAILALWVPSSLLQEGLNTMKAWGFAHKQTYVWVKSKKIDNIKKALFKTALDICDDLENKIPKLKAFRNFTINLHASLAFGMGRLFRQTHEICLIGTSNNQIYKTLSNKSQRSVCFAQNLKHSAKPEHLQDSLELMFPTGKKLELFARRHRPGWTCLGNEICNGEDIRVSLAKL
jgi:N6-adenosine-specific RNA methylase IME4